MAIQDLGGFLAGVENSLKAVAGNAAEVGRVAADARSRLQVFSTSAADLVKLEALLATYTTTLKGVDAAHEQLARGMEGGVGSAVRNLETSVGKAKSKFGELKDSIGATATSLGQFASSGNNANTSANNLVSSFTSLLGAIPFIGKALEASVNIFIGMSNKIQETNRVILDLNASTGQLGRGFDLLTNDKGANFAKGVANFALLTGRSSEEIRKFAGDLGRAGFSMEEMGWDTKTGDIDSFTKGIAGAATSVGGLATAFGFARSMGVDVGQVLSTMQVMMKEMGVSSEGTIKALYSIEGASRTAGVSQAVMLQSTQQLQGAFKYLGMDSERVIMSLGAVGAAAQRAGFGGQLGVEVFTQAAQGLMSNFSMMTFMGQRLGMGKGLGAGFAMRESMVSDGGVLNVGKSIESMTQLLGGRYVSRGEAAMGGPAAASRLAQEQMAMQMFGVSQNQASSLLDMSEKLTGLERAGLGGTAEAKSLAAIMSKMTLTEGDYRNKTLTLQEKIAFALELIYASLTKIVTSIFRAMFPDSAAVKKYSSEAMAGTVGGKKDKDGKIIEETSEEWIDRISKWGKGAEEFVDEALAGGLGQWVLPGLGNSINEIIGYFGELGTSILGLVSFMKDVPWLGDYIYEAEEKAKREAAARKQASETHELQRKAIEVRQNPNISGEEREKELKEIDYNKTKSMLTYRAGEMLTNVNSLFSVTGGGAGFGGVGSPQKTFKGIPQDFSGLEEQLKKQSASGNLSSELQKAFQDLSKAKTYATEVEIFTLLANLKTQLEKDKAGGVPKPAVKDAWDISKAGWLYASQGDVVVDSKSIGRALSSGNRGDALNYSQIFSQSAPTPAAATGGQQNVEHDIVFNVRVNSDMLGTIVDQRVVYNIDRDIIKPGRGYSNASQGSVSR